jgi:hypothetical protein
MGQHSFYAYMETAPTTLPTDVRHGARARLRFLDEQAFWRGRVNRSDLMERFGVSVPQATADLGKYQELAPGNLVYDRQAKAYVTTEAFRPVFGAPAAEAWLRELAGGAGTGEFPAEELPLPQRALDPWLVRRVVRSIRSGCAFRVQYQSMEPSEPEPIWRWVSPLAIASDGLRWHLRAYNHDTARHEDLVFPRMFEIGEERAAGDVPPDKDWQQIVTVRLRASAALSPSQRRAVAIDFRMEGGVVEVPVRAAMLANFLRRMRLDRGGRLVEVVNQEEVDAALDEIRTMFNTGPHDPS